ncbi:poly(U)-specific endoribonuclease-B [Salix suchowensis]|nr:poly(U)-specific endoribonuclease-B [Salix suchowensis]
MDGLIKGLMDVALDHFGQKDDESRDERSRSSWAQVVSGEEQDDLQSQGYNRNNQRESQENEGRRNEGWETEGSRRPQKVLSIYLISL